MSVHTIEDDRPALAKQKVLALASAVGLQRLAFSQHVLDATFGLTGLVTFYDRRMDPGDRRVIHLGDRLVVINCPRLEAGCFWLPLWSIWSR